MNFESWDESKSLEGVVGRLELYRTYVLLYRTYVLKILTKDCMTEQDCGGLHAGLSRTACMTEHSYVERSISHTVRFIHAPSGQGQTISLLGNVTAHKKKLKLNLRQSYT